MGRDKIITVTLPKSSIAPESPCCPLSLQTSDANSQTRHIPRTFQQNIRPPLFKGADFNASEILSKEFLWAKRIKIINAQAAKRTAQSSRFVVLFKRVDRNRRKYRKSRCGCNAHKLKHRFYGFKKCRNLLNKHKKHHHKPRKGSS